jgi:hypothetical protein
LYVTLQSRSPYLVYIAYVYVFKITFVQINIYEICIDSNFDIALHKALYTNVEQIITATKRVHMIK